MFFYLLTVNLGNMNKQIDHRAPQPVCAFINLTPDTGSSPHSSIQRLCVKMDEPCQPEFLSLLFFMLAAWT